MNWEGSKNLMNVNYLIAFVAIGLGLLLPFFSGEYEFRFFEKILFVSFFLSFGIVFILFAQQYGKYRSRVSKNKRSYFYLANGVAFILFLLLFFSFNSSLQENHIWLANTVEVQGKVYKIDPEGYRKTRTIYYTFEHKGNRYNGQKVNPNNSYKIGDTVTVLFSQKKPEVNTLLVNSE